MAKYGTCNYDRPGTGFGDRGVSEQANSMRRSHDKNESIQINMYSLGVMDLDLSISPDVFGLRAFDAEQPVKRMLPGSSPCELRLMLPDDKLGIDGFHDVIIDNLSALRQRTLPHCAGDGRRLYLTPYDAGRRM